MRLDAGGVSVHGPHAWTRIRFVPLRIGSPFQPVAVDGDHGSRACLLPVEQSFAVVFHVGQALRVLAVHTAHLFALVYMI
ncbi:hypothetical protein BDA96_01G190500 [Sorghum bicolor]|uniref:Uncharacterized protein n=2 Tax=Sorghum bicolor TaxID=4558 RepID=A0A921V0L2_SORBI|nr:hypothetical protein BDA96_01G190500 [Sorghum bicolor]KXG38106.1 hypothetical protein SORBI_3001G181400 [Sorghum bicolor]